MAEEDVPRRPEEADRPGASGASAARGGDAGAPPAKASPRAPGPGVGEATPLAAGGGPVGPVGPGGPGDPPPGARPRPPPPALPVPPPLPTLGAALFVASLALYWRTLYPSVAGGDATEFAFHACQWGVPHPPGYPTFAVAVNLSNAVLGPLFRALGVRSSPAHRANLTGALFGALANVGVFLAGARLAGARPARGAGAAPAPAPGGPAAPAPGRGARRGRGRGRQAPGAAPGVPPAPGGPPSGLAWARAAWREVWSVEGPAPWAVREVWAGAACAVAFGLSRLHWHYSLQSEVFTLNSLFCASLLVALAHLSSSGDPSWAQAGALLSGLGLTNQHTLVLYVAPLAVHALVAHRRSLAHPWGLVR